MKKAIIVLLILAVLITAGCESKEEKAAREARELRLEQERIAREKAINASIEKCSQLEGFNNTVCFVNEIVSLNDNQAVVQLCSNANSTDFCYFYSSYLANNSNYCSKMENPGGCKLLFDNNFCKDLINRGNCYTHKAFMLRYIDRGASLTMCRYISRISRNYFDPHDNLSCSDIEFDEQGYDSWVEEDKVFFAYIMSSLGNYTIYTIRI